MAEHIARLEQHIDRVENAAMEAERNKLKYGIMLLGGIVSTLFAVIWAYRALIFGDGSPMK